MSDPYDVLTIAAVTDELAATIGGGRIQRIGLVDARTVGAEIYAGGQRHHLLASADDRRPGLRLVAGMPSLDPSLVTPFGLLLRKHVRGGIILGIDQPPLERLVRLSIARRRPPLKNEAEAFPAPGVDPEGDGEDDETEEEIAAAEAADLIFVSLAIELMGRHSNLILIDDEGRIFDSAKRVTPAMSRVRVVLPRLPYVPPPPLDRRDPRQAAAAEMSEMLSTGKPNDDLARSLIATYRGLSPTMAREIVYRALGPDVTRLGDSGPEAATALARETRALLAPLASAGWQPRVYRHTHGEHEGAVVTFTALPMAHLAATYDEIAVSSISAAAEMAEDAAGHATPQRHAQRRERLLTTVQAARARAERRLAALAEQSLRAQAGERWKRWGELIYAWLWQIEPGQTLLEVADERIPLDPTLSPSDNAQAYFERYRKAQGAESQLPDLVEESRVELAYLEQLTTMIAQAPGFAELEALAAEWNDGHDRAPEPGARKKRKQAPRRPRPLADAAGNLVYVGHSGPQNELLTFELAGPDDTWLHARGVGGSHVIIRWQATDAAEREETVGAAAALAAWYSAARGSGAVEVDVARRRHVRKLKGGGPGMVTYRNERTIRVQPLPEAELREVLEER